MHKKVEPKWMARAATGRARNAIAELVNENVDTLGDLLLRVANGLPKLDANGEVLRDADGSVRWVCKPAPADAVKLISDLSEFVIPKLSRSDLTVASQVEHNHGAVDVRSLSTDELKRMVLRSAGIDSMDVFDLEAITIAPESTNVTSGRSEYQPESPDAPAPSKQRSDG